MSENRLNLNKRTVINDNDKGLPLAYHLLRSLEAFTVDYLLSFMSVRWLNSSSVDDLFAMRKSE